MGNNQISGSLPEWIGDFTALQWVNLADNRLTGPIPSQIGNCTALAHVYLQARRGGDGCCGCSILPVSVVVVVLVSPGVDVARDTTPTCTSLRGTS